MKILIELVLSLALLVTCALAAQTADRVSKLQDLPSDAASCAQAACDTVLLAAARSDRAAKTPPQSP